jgi:hypothetical protein
MKFVLKKVAEIYEDHQPLLTCWPNAEAEADSLVLK